MKRLSDFSLSLIGLVLLSPVLLVVSVLVGLTSQGSVLYTQERVGLWGKTFRIYKFRTMVDGADEDVSDVPTALFKRPDDPRITAVGKVLRKYSLDELPQLFNVLKGDMSLVGPRPQIQAEVDLYSDADYVRLTVLPGLTGLWQVSGRSDIGWAEGVRLDTHYVHNYSWLLDWKILFKTAAVLFNGKGAY